MIVVVAPETLPFHRIYAAGWIFGQKLPNRVPFERDRTRRRSKMPGSTGQNYSLGENNKNPPTLRTRRLPVPGAVGSSGVVRRRVPRRGYVIPNNEQVLGVGNRRRVPRRRNKDEKTKLLGVVDRRRVPRRQYQTNKNPNKNAHKNNQ